MFESTKIKFQLLKLLSYFNSQNIDKRANGGIFCQFFHENSTCKKIKFITT